MRPSLPCSRVADKIAIHPTTDRLPVVTSTPPPRPNDDAAPSTSSQPTGQEEFHSNVHTFLNAAPESAAAAPFTPRPDLCENFRHSGWSHNRKLVDAALTIHEKVSPRRLGAFRACGSDARVECGHFPDNGGPTPEACMVSAIKAAHPHYRLRSTKCHDRFCVPCSNERSLRIRDALRAHMQPLKDLSLITLTLRATDAPLAAVMDKLTKCFRSLRTKALWKKNVTGGVSIIETKIGDGSGHWHCHYHIVCEAKFLRQNALSDLWFEITSDSRIVDIRRVGSKNGAISYITKYITKAADTSILTSPKHLSESISAFAGRRMVSTFGSWRGLELMESPDENALSEIPPEAWTHVGSLDEILTRAIAGDAEAIRIVQIIAPRKFEHSG